MTEWIWLGFVIVANLLSVTLGQLPVTPAGILSQRDIIKNQMRNVFSGRSGYIPILSYLRVRGGSISSVTRGKSNQRVSTARPVGPVSGRTVDSGMQFRKGQSWIYMVPSNNGHILDERRRLNIPFRESVLVTKISTTPSGSFAVSSATTAHQNVRQSSANIYTESRIIDEPVNLTPFGLNIPNDVSTAGSVLSEHPNGSVVNRSTSFDNVSTNSIVPITKNGTIPQPAGNVSANSSSVTHGITSHVLGQGALPSLLVREVEESGGRTSVQGHNTNVYVDDRTGDGNIKSRGGNHVLAPPGGEDVQLLQNGEGYNNNNIAQIDDLQTHNKAHNMQETKPNNNSTSILTPQVLVDEANDLFKSNTNDTEIMLDDRQSVMEQRVNNILVVPPSSSNVDQKSTISSHTIKANISKQANTNEVTTSLTMCPPSVAEGIPSSNTPLNSPNHITGIGVIKGIHGGSEITGNETGYLMGRGNTSLLEGAVQSKSIQSDVISNTSPLEGAVRSKSIQSDVISNTSIFEGAVQSKSIQSDVISNISPLEGAVQSKSIQSDVISNTSPLEGTVRSKSIQSYVISNTKSGTVPYNTNLINTTPLVLVVKAVDIRTHYGVGNAVINKIKSHKPNVSVENNNPVGNSLSQNIPAVDIISHVPVDTNNHIHSEEKQLIQPESIKRQSTFNIVNKTNANKVGPINQVMATATTVRPQKPLSKTQSIINREQLYRFLSRSFKPYPWAQTRPKIADRMESPKTQGSTPLGIRERVTQSVFTVRFIDQNVPTSQGTPSSGNLPPKRLTSYAANFIPVTENPSTKANVNTQTLIRPYIHKPKLLKTAVTLPVIVQATPSSDAQSAYTRPVLPVIVQATPPVVIVQATPPSFNTDVPDTLAGKKLPFKNRYPVAFSFDFTRIGNVSNKLSTLVNRSITAQGSGNQVDSNTQNSFADGVNSQTLSGTSRIDQPSGAKVETKAPHPRSNLRSQLQDSSVNNGVNTNLATPSKTMNSNMNSVGSETKVSGSVLISGPINTAMGNSGTDVNLNTVHNSNPNPFLNTIINAGRVGTDGRSVNVMNVQTINNGIGSSSNGSVSSPRSHQSSAFGANKAVDGIPTSTVNLPNDKNSSNRTRIVDLRVDPMRMYQYLNLFRPPTISYNGNSVISAPRSGGSAPTQSIPFFNSNISIHPVTAIPTTQPKTVSLKKFTVVQLVQARPVVQAGPITTGKPNTPMIPITGFPMAAPSSVSDSSATIQFALNNAYSIFSKRPPSVTGQGNLLNSAGGIGTVSQTANYVPANSKIETSVPTTSANSGSIVKKTLFQDRGPPIGINTVSLEPNIQPISSRTEQPPTSTELLSNSTALVEALDVFNLTAEQADMNNLTIGLSVLDLNDTMMNDSFADNITTTTTTSLPTTTPFGSMNALCGAHLVGHPDMPPPPTTTTLSPYFTRAPTLYQFPWHNPLHPEYEPPEPSEAPEYELIPGQNTFAPAPPPTLPIGQCFCMEKAECEGLGATQGLPYEYMCDISAGLSCCCEPS